MVLDEYKQVENTLSDDDKLIYLGDMQIDYECSLEYDFLISDGIAQFNTLIEYESIINLMKQI